jgi:hypothetical protein
MEKFNTLFRVRFDERNRRMIERFTEEKQRFNARNILISTETIKAMYAVLEMELKESVEVVVETAFDVIEGLPPTKKNLQKLCSEAFLKRKDEIEALYLSSVSHIEQGLQNKTMLQPCMSLQDFYCSQQNEILASVSSSYDEYIRDRGGNRANVLKNYYLNNKIISWFAAPIVVLIAVIEVASSCLEFFEFLKKLFISI